MKRTWAIILSAAAIATGCSERVENPQDGLEGITFSTPGVTRGTAVTTPALLAAAGGFDVWAYSHAGTWSTAATKNELMKEVAVTSADGGIEWTYNQPKEWPANNDNVTFFAYSPTGAATVTYDDTDQTPQVEYTVADDVAQQKDLLIADQLYNQQGIDYFPTVRKVGLYFRHTLSQISFAACYTGTQANAVKLTGIVLKNVYNSGKAAMTNPVAWTVYDTSTADYSLSVSGNTLNDIALDATPQDVTAPGAMLYLIPQTIGRTADPIEMEITFDIDGGSLSYTSPVLLPVEWLPGKSYKYQIALDDGAIRVIVIDNETELNAWSNSIALEMVMLTGNKVYDQNNFTFALNVLNMVNTGGGIPPGGTDRLYYGIYGAAEEVTHEISIDMGIPSFNNFTTGQMLVFDFKKTVFNWGTDGTDPWKISVTNYSDEWILSPSQQNLPVDATTGATTLTPSDVITARGSIILKKR